MYKEEIDAWITKEYYKNKYIAIFVGENFKSKEYRFSTKLIDILGGDRLEYIQKTLINGLQSYFVILFYYTIYYNLKNKKNKL